MNYTLEEIHQTYNLPFTELVFQAQLVARKHHKPNAVRFCSNASVKTGGCPEDCAFCPQSAHYKTGVPSKKFLNTEEIVELARRAKERGATRFSLGTAWKRIPKGETFNQLVEAVHEVSKLGLHVCCVTGSADADQLQKLKEAGLSGYGFNLDTSRNHYSKVIKTRSYDERLEDLKVILKSGLHLCSGGILGMGESLEDRLSLLQELANLDPQPESVPINMLCKIKGTPLENTDPIDHIEFARFVATSRIFLKDSTIVLAAGRYEMGSTMQALCFLAGANSILIGEKLLTTPNPSTNEDANLIEKLGLEQLV